MWKKSRKFVILIPGNDDFNCEVRKISINTQTEALIEIAWRQPM